MPRILVVDDDALARAVVADAVRACGFEVVTATGGAQGLDLVLGQPFAGALVDVRMPDIDGFELVKRARQRGVSIPFVFVSAVRDAEVLSESARRGVEFAGFVPKPVSKELVGRLLARWCAPLLPIREEPGDEWGAEDVLRRVDGPVERFPPARLLFVAHRSESTGALLVEHGGRSVVVAVRGGRLVWARGVPGLVPSLGEGGTGELGADVGAAIAAGGRPDEVMTEAAGAIGRWAMRLVGETGGSVRWDATFRTPSGAFPLPVAIPRVLTAARSASVTTHRLDELWGGRMWASIRLRVPEDSNEQRWGLDMTAMRVVRAAAAGASELGAVVDRAVGVEPGRRADVLRAVDLLYVLGLLKLGETSLPPAASVAPPVADPAQIAAFRARLAEMEGRRACEILGLADKPPLTPASVQAAFRELSRTMHPDNFFSAATEVRTLAEACFSRVNTAYEALQDAAVLEEENRYVDARKKGIPYVSEADKLAARVSFRRGELAFRNRDWKEADLHLARAAQVDPLTWPHGLLAIHAGWLARRLTPADALAELGRLRADKPEREAEALVLAGNILKVDGKTDEAMARFREALSKHPENRDAQREVRLQERRAPPPPPPSSTAGLFAGLMKRKS